MRRLQAALLALFVLPASAHAATTVRAGGATATVQGDAATLSNGRISRSWRTGADGVVTTALRQGAHGPNWSTPRSPDFTLTLDRVETSSTSGWSLTSLTARPEPADPARP